MTAGVGTNFTVDKSPAHARLHARSMELVYLCRWASYIANVILWVLGMGTFIAMFVLVQEFPEVLAIPEFMTIAICMEISGFSVFLAGFIGCCGSVRINRISFKAFFIVGIIVWLLVAAFAGYLVARADTFRFVEEMQWSLLKNSTVDSLQTKYQCCGFNGPSDFLTSTPMRLSCFRKELFGSRVMLTSYEDGCFKQIETIFVVTWILCIVLISGGLFSLLLGLLGTLGLDNHLRRQKQREDDKLKAAEKAMAKLAFRRQKQTGLAPVSKA